MGLKYAVTFSAVAATLAQDFFEINAAAAKPLVIHACFIGQYSEAGDAQDEMLGILIKRGQSTSGSGGSAPTPNCLDSPGATATFTAEANNTTKAGTGTILTLHSDAFNVRSGFMYVPTPEMRPVIPGGGRATVELVAAPADSVTFNGTLIVEELG